MVKKVTSQIRFEIGQVDYLFEIYADLFDQVQQKKPTIVEITAIASVLHSFYNGVENIFLSIVKEIDQDVPNGNQWHRDLLTRMSKPVAERQQVLSSEITSQLADYLGFRHFYRHSYSFLLEWNELETLLIPLPEIWQRVKDELSVFLDSLETNNTE